MNIKKISDKLIWLFVIFFVGSFYIFESYSWGKYVTALVSVAIFLLSFFQDRRISVKPQPFHWFLLAFALYCFLSSMWAWSKEDATSKGFTIIQILICFSFLYMHYQKVNSTDSLISAIMWAGYLIAIYSFIYYGGFIKVMQLLTDGIRLDNEYTNVNAIGMICAIACVIQIYRITYVKFSWSTIFMIPTIIMIAATQSRKALVLLFGGMMAVVVLKTLSSKDILKSAVKLLLALGIFVICFYFLLKLEIFSGINERMQGWFDSFLGREEAAEGSSLWLRKQYRRIGMEQFFKTPLLGIGIGSSHLLTQTLGRDTYLHNNFVELLACGGIIGFTIYYSIYAYLFYQLFKYRKYDNRGFAICFILLAILFVMDYGTVSYYSKTQYFYFMLCFLEVRNMKRKAKENFMEEFYEYLEKYALSEKIYR